mmetsp:Transcript_29883/g.28761  ORF Transcript_29883/g.28761 Transcript_29883/m.28761 type:complete len:225 (-) Transcript_29883:91-765(-)|eukprot:CAMPEP_0197827368 /NCGR_PEP_ID=MMETSP1437-20131217/4160_1 /TAXON_ID=49252 ORGANISM="Eucampia antarctica, Strain CCMP1452" /NCGR_SAMPLE_ID=MMETSP1437 /ASSEMBLY_ACC=CAM_ASM_001096 /LENGTH=224 /DNA_ID=CAMNT_0043428179 /DNA_START=84 /DNA_END=758 /DNA_ORIENTATION=-
MLKLLFILTWFFPLHCQAFMVSKQISVDTQQYPLKTSSTSLYEMKRPILDRVASTLFKLENSRVESSSVTDEKGRLGEPMEWSDDSSFANKFSETIASNDLGYKFKQWVADIVAGDYNEEETQSLVKDFVGNDKVTMFSFTTCPFCRRAKDYLDEKGIEYSTMELDLLEGNKGNEIRAILGKNTRRTSVPSIFINGQYIGGCNDGPGLLPLGESGELEKILASK